MGSFAWLLPKWSSGRSSSSTSGSFDFAYNGRVVLGMAGFLCLVRDGCSALLGVDFGGFRDVKL